MVLLLLSVESDQSEVDYPLSSQTAVWSASSLVEGPGMGMGTGGCVLYTSLFHILLLDCNDRNVLGVSTVPEYEFATPASCPRIISLTLPDILY